MNIKHPRAALAGIGLAVSLGVLSATHAGAQDTAPAPETAPAQETAPTPAPAPAPAAPAEAPAAAPDPATVVATVGGAPITEADLALAISDLDQQFSQLPPEQRRAAALAAIIEIRVLAAAAVEKGLDKEAEFQRQLEFLRQR